MSGAVRQATTVDADAVRAIHDRAWANTDRRSLLADRLESGDCLVVESEGRVEGFATLHPRSFFGRDFVELLVVDADRRRQGIGSELLRAALRHSTTSEMFTSTNRSNLAMQSLLRREGWLFSGELDGLDEGDPELVFHRRCVE